ncbi:MAG: BrnT family toxin, partial [Lachnospiraceae bacterium]|nr:BrnT family toxin [Lachnospiraceae bacterium]
NKSRLNKKKHGISFEAALSVFDDRGAILFDDPEHSIDEGRFVIIGYAENVQILHCEPLLSEESCICRGSKE